MADIEYVCPGIDQVHVLQDKGKSLRRRPGFSYLIPLRLKEIDSYLYMPTFLPDLMRERTKQRSEKRKATHICKMVLLKEVGLIHLFD